MNSNEKKLSPEKRERLIQFIESQNYKREFELENFSYIGNVPDPESSFFGKRVAFTGFSNNREHNFADIVSQIGGIHVRGVVTLKTDFLVVSNELWNDPKNETSKIKKAKEYSERNLPIQIITEEQFLSEFAYEKVENSSVTDMLEDIMINGNGIDEGNSHFRVQINLGSCKKQNKPAGIYNQKINETPISFIDFETTGLVKGYDRVIEVSVARLEPGGEPTIVYDTLINPGRRVSATDIHGITDKDVSDAPDFREIAGDLVNAIKGSVISSYNVYFDIPFLEHELSRCGINVTPPHFCMMYMRPLLELGSRCSLGEACKNHGIEMQVSHVAAADVLSTANLFKSYSKTFSSKEIETFDDLTQQRRNYKFFDSFECDPFSSADELGLVSFGKTKSRSDDILLQIEKSKERNPVTIYWDLLKTVVSDLVITNEELKMIEEEKSRLDISIEQVRAMHAKIFAVVIAQFTDDDFLDDKERSKLHRLYKCLDILGWAPGN